MAVDNTPPRLRLIATIAVISIITLIGLNAVFESYYSYMSDEARREKIAPTSEKDDAVKAAAAALAGAKVPIEQAMAQLKDKRAELVEPKPSDDLGPMTGWTKLPKAFPALPPGASARPPDKATATDAGAPGASDGSAARRADGGTPAADAGESSTGAVKDPPPPGLD